MDFCSNFREVPDHQEVWADANTDQSIIIEILAYEPTVTDDNVLAFHWNELASSNGATGEHSQITATQILAPEMVPGVAYDARPL